MPAPDRELDFVLDELRRLHTLWDCFEELFLQKGRTRLQAHAQHLLVVIRFSVVADIVLTINRLCDTFAGPGGQQVVFDRFLFNHPSARTAVRPLLRELKRLHKKDLQPIRHSRLAHNDLSWVLGGTTVKWPTVATLQRAKDLCTEIVCVLSAEIESAMTSFVKSHVAGEVDWIEAALRFLEPDREKIHDTLMKVRRERYEDPAMSSQNE